MNPKINKLRAEVEKNNAKIATLQAKNKALEKQIRELENTDIIGMVREQGMTIEEFAELFQTMKGAAVAAPAVKEFGHET
jgi:DNA-binding transcriptional regulator YiaG